MAFSKKQEERTETIEVWNTLKNTYTRWKTWTSKTSVYEATNIILQNHKNEWEPWWVVQKKDKMQRGESILWWSFCIFITAMSTWCYSSHTLNCNSTGIDFYQLYIMLMSIEYINIVNEHIIHVVVTFRQKKCAYLQSW